MAPTLLALFCLIVCASRAAAGSKSCYHRSPIQIPILQDVKFNRDNRSPEPAATITLRTEYPPTEPEFFIDESEKWNDKRIRINEQNRNPYYAMTTERDETGDYVLKVYARREFHSMFGYAVFDLGCYNIVMFFGLSGDSNSNGTFSPWDLGRIVQFPPSNVVVKPNEDYAVRYEVESREMIRLHTRVMSYRNESGLFQDFRSQRESPLGLNIETTPGARPGPGESTLIETKFKWPEGFHDLLLQVQLSPLDRSRNRLIDHFAVTYTTDFHTNWETESLVEIRHCSFKEPDPVNENGGVRLFVKANRQMCLFAISNGNPLPQIALAEMSGPNTVARLLREQSEGGWIDTYAYTSYLLDGWMQPGEEKKYVLAIKDGRGTLSFRDVTLEAYEPSDGVLRPGNVTIYNDE